MKLLQWTRVPSRGFHAKYTTKEHEIEAFYVSAVIRKNEKHITTVNEYEIHEVPQVTGMEKHKKLSTKGE